MKRHVVLFGAILCVTVAAMTGTGLSQRRGYRTGSRPPQVREQERRLAELREENERRREQQRLESQRRSQEMAAIVSEYKDEISQEALGVNAEQWKVMQAKMERIRELRAQPALSFSVYGFAGGGSEHSASSSDSGVVPGAGVGGSGHGRSGGGGGSSGGSVRYGFGGGSGGGSSGGGSYEYSTGNSSGAGWGYSIGGGAGPNGDRPVKKRVGELNLGWMWRRPSEDKKAEELTEGERVCERLLDALEAKEPNEEGVQQSLAALRQLRQDRQRQLAEAQQELRAIVTAQQEAKLILMGYLD